MQLQLILHLKYYARLKKIKDFKNLKYAYCKFKFIPVFKFFGSFQSFNVVSILADTIKPKSLEMATVFTAPVCRDPMAIQLAVLLTLQYDHTLML